MPPELNRDEAALGYNAYSLVKTGLDEWGKPWPVVFRSFGDMKLPGYIYLLTPFIALFGLQNWVVRLPSLLAGILLIPSTYFFAKKLNISHAASLLAALAVSVSPWALHYGTTAFEANVSLCLFLWFLICLFETRKKMYTVWLAGFFLLCSLLTYNAPLMLAPIILVAAYMIKKIRLSEFLIITSFLLFAFILVFPASQGKSGIGLWSNPQVAETANQLRVESKGSFFGKIFYRPVFLVLPVMLQQHIQAFTPYFLVQGKVQNPWHTIGSSGFIPLLLYLLTIIGLILCAGRAVWSVLKKKSLPKSEFLLLVLTLSAPLPASFTQDAPHATRSLFLFVMCSVLSMWCVDQWRNHWKNRNPLVGRISIFFIALYFVVAGIYSTSSRMQFPKEKYSIDWWVGARKIFTDATALSEKVAVIGDVHYSYIYPLYFAKTDPNQYRANTVRVQDSQVGLVKVASFGKFVFSASVSDIPEDVHYYIVQVAPGMFELKRK